MCGGSSGESDSFTPNKAGLHHAGFFWQITELIQDNELIEVNDD
jgi:hypothetical protein